MALLTAHAGADHAGQLLLRDGEEELVGPVGQLQQPLRRAAGHVEEHGIGQRLVHAPEPVGQHPHDAPQQLGMVLEQVPNRAVLEDQHLGRFERSTLGRARPPVEHAHLAEQVAGFHERHDALPAVERLVGDGHPTAQDHVQGVGLLALVEEDVAAHQPAVAGVAPGR